MPSYYAEHAQQLKRDLAEKYPNEPIASGRAAQQIAHFCKTMQPRDYVIASDEQETLGVGKVVDVAKDKRHALSCRQS